MRCPVLSCTWSEDCPPRQVVTIQSSWISCPRYDCAFTEERLSGCGAFFGFRFDVFARSNIFQTLSLSLRTTLHMLNIRVIVAVCKNHKQKPLLPPQRKFCSLTSLVDFTNVAYGGMLVDRMGEQDVLLITSVHCPTAWIAYGMGDQGGLVGILAHGTLRRPELHLLTRTNIPRKPQN